MQDKTAIGNIENANTPSKAFREYIESLVEEVVLNNAVFNDHKKYLQRYSQEEGLGYTELEKNLADFFEVIEEWNNQKSKSSQLAAKMLAQCCYLSDNEVDKLLESNHPTRVIIQQSKREGNRDESEEEKVTSKKKVVQKKVRSQPHQGPLFPAWHEKSQKYGYIDLNGKWVFKPEFESAECFSEGLAPVRIRDGWHDKWGYIDMSGDMVVPPAEYASVYRFSDGVARVYPKGGSGTTFIDKKGNVVLQHRSSCGDFFDGMAVVMIGRDRRHAKHGFIDKTGKYIIKPEYGWLAWHFSEGLAAFKIDPLYEASDCGFIDKTGRVAIEPRFNCTNNFSEGLAYVRNGRDGWWIDKSGKEAIKHRPYDDGTLYAADSFSDGLALFYIEKKGSTFTYNRGYIDKSGNVVIDFARHEGLLYLNSFSEGLARIEENDKWGFIDKTGKWVVKPQYDYAWDFSNGLAMVKSNNSFGYINKQGDLVYMSNLR